MNAEHLSQADLQAIAQMRAALHRWGVVLPIEFQERLLGELLAITHRSRDDHRRDARFRADDPSTSG